MTTMTNIEATCEVCGDSFVPNGKRNKRCAKEHYRNCVACGEPFLVTANMLVTKVNCSKKCAGVSKRKSQYCVVCGNSFRKASKTCSTECANKLRDSNLTPIEKKCEWCGKTFTTVAGRVKKFCSGEHYKDCEVCGVSFIVNPYLPRRTCSNLCNGQLVNTPESNAKRRETSLKNWGTEFPQQSEQVKEKIEAACMEKFGTSSPLSNAAIRAKGRATSLEKYGAEYYAVSEEGKKARAATNLRLYGAENVFASKQIQEVIKQTMLSKYGVANQMKNKDIVAKNQQTNLERYGVPNVHMVEEFKIKSNETFARNVNNGSVIHSKVSKVNLAAKKRIEDAFGVNVSLEEGFGRFQADLCVTGNNGSRILVDIHPTVSHNSERSFSCAVNGCVQPCVKHSPVAKNYHYRRAVVALENDVSLVQWFGWDSFDSLLGFLSQRVVGGFRKVSARKLLVRKVSQREANAFLREFHIQGAGRGQSYCVGLFDAGELLAVATFGPVRFRKNAGGDEWEFIRFAVRDGVIIHGGPMKLFERFVSDCLPGSVVSYVDFNHTTRGRVFLNSLGFVESVRTGPALVWDKNFVQELSGVYKPVKDTSLLAVGADRILGTSYGSVESSGLNNHGIMLAEGFLPVYTAGNRVFVRKF